jgi:hypothetical protein
MRSVARLVVAAVLAMCIGGCAFQDVHLTMGSVSQYAALTGGQGRRVVVVVPFEDSRGVVRCGMMKNGYNMDTADAICPEPPAAWIARLLANELRAAGFLVTTEGAPAEAPGVDRDVLRVEGDLLTLFVEPVIGFWEVTLETDFEVRLAATTASGLLAERGFFVKGSKQSVGAFKSVFQSSFDDATRQIVREMVVAITILMNRYPELGGGLSSDQLRLALSVGDRR